MPGTITTTRPILLNFRVSADEQRAIKARAGTQDMSKAVRAVVMAWAWGTTRSLTNADG